MDLFDKLLKGKDDGIVLCAPAKGSIEDITKVSDETFAKKILGDGIAILPSSGQICSPCNGTVDNMFEAGHAFSIISDEGTEILIHAGFDTVELKGEHFKVFKETGDKVKTGDPMVEMDLEAVKAAGYDDTVVMIILNTDAYKDFIKAEGEAVIGAEVLKLVKK